MQADQSLSSAFISLVCEGFSLGSIHLFDFKGIHMEMGYVTDESHVGGVG